VLCASPAPSKNEPKVARTPAAFEEDAMAAVTRAHKQNPFMIAPFCYAGIFNEVDIICVCVSISIYLHMYLYIHVHIKVDMKVKDRNY
jgi:hypothetical protein